MTNVKEKAIIYDLDGVVVDSRIRLAKYVDHAALAAGDTKKFIASLQEYGTTTEGDTPIQEGINLVHALWDCCKLCKLIAVTARGENGRALTQKWLMNRGLYWDGIDELIMRPYSLECVPSVDYKRDVVLALIQKYDILYAIDDQSEITDMYRTLGIPPIHFQLRDVDCTFNPKTGEEKKCINPSC